MNKIILSADSSCDLNPLLLEKYNIHLFACPVILEGIQCKDNIDVTPDMIYETYANKKILPKTSAPNTQEYIDYFKPFVEDGYEVIHFNIGTGLSCAHQNCRLAAEEFDGVYVIDTKNLSTGYGLQVYDAALMLENGATAKEINQYFNSHTSDYHASFVIDTLEFLHAGGRCSSLAAFGANLLNLKPSIEVDNTSGAMTVGKKYRGDLKKVLPKYVKDQLSSYPNIKTDCIFITHSGIDAEYINLVKEAITNQMAFTNIFISRASCSVSAHCGPNTLGVLFRTDSDAI